MPSTRSQTKKVEKKKVAEPDVNDDDVVRTIKEANIKRIGYQPAIAETYKSKEYMTMADVKEIIKDRIEEFKNEKLQGLEFFVSVLDRSGRPASSAEFTMEDDFNLGELVDYDGNEIVADTKNFTLIVWKPDYHKLFNVAPPKEGGCDNNYNDCLFRCIERALGGDSELPAGINTPPKFKKYLGLNKCDKRDYSYKSTKTYIPSINLKLTDGHYEYDKKKNKKEDLLLTLNSKKELPIIIEKESKDFTLTYDGNEEKKMSFEEIQKLKTHKMKGYYYYIKDDPKMSLKDTYDSLMKDNEALKEYGIDLHKTHGNTKNASIRQLYNDIAHTEGPEKITEFEEKWLLEGSRGPLVYGATREEFKGYQYDGNSYYSSNLLKIGIPMKQPEWITITEDVPEFFSYGMYRCRIERSGKQTIDQNFKFNREHFYTHYDLECAKLLGLKMCMIHDNEANFMSYTGKHISGKYIFGKTLNKFYGMKLNKVPRAKDLMTRLWGGLCKKYKTTVHEKSNGVIPANAKIISMDRVLDKNGDVVNIIADYVIKGQTFQYRFGRIEPFLLAYSRLQLVKTIFPHLDKIKRVHTDSFLSTVPFDSLKTGQAMGQFKIEHYDQKVKLNSKDGRKRPEWF